ncbi:GT2 family glycosyltransferase [Algoriphagus iocasae]|uniref:GT2 family glycosyltransferase n=1 Tax=Algoriphagus iocasae TaxID=1836499 RepID=A0A841MCR0_9BACT|nr:glycosyltransferase [Algoriphagus iocasae]MBB6325852.1 GT2 family glycosyltransferase [Algoriphagus iocasae]
MQEIDIIILSNARTQELREITCQAIESLLASEDPDKIRFLIQVYESADTHSYVYPYCNTKFPKRPFNYNRFMNMGIRSGKAPFICLCNNDLLFQPNWASNLLKAFECFPDMNSASPYCPMNHEERGVQANSGVHWGYEVRKHIAGWCLFFKRSMLERTGLLDERFKFWYADNDYAKTLQAKQVLHGLVTDSHVYHLESQTLKTKSEREQLLLTTEERYVYEYKWEGRSYFSYLNTKRKKFFKNLNS